MFVYEYIYISRCSERKKDKLDSLKKNDLHRKKGSEKANDILGENIHNIYHK